MNYDEAIQILIWAAQAGLPYCLSIELCGDSDSDVDYDAEQVLAALKVALEKWTSS